MGKAKYGILHNHTEFSVRDSAMSIDRLFERAKELEAPAVALTDHGILTGIIDFMKAGERYGVKPIPGIEAYFIPDGEALSKGEKNTVPAKAQHLVLMAKDLQGYHAICKAVYLSYRYIVRDNPCMDFDILQRVFGPGSEGHDHVIATSACVGGPLASILLEDEMLKQSTEKLIRQRDKYHPVDNEVVDAVFKEEQFASEIDALIKKREELTEAAKVNLNGLKRKLKAMKPEDADYAKAEQELADATKAKEDASTALTEVKREIAEKKRAKSAYSKSIAAMKSSAEKWVSIDDKINAVLASGSGDEALYQKATEACKKLNDIFGEGNFYIELQHHHITNEKKVMPLLAKMAGELNIPVVAANDAHYATRTYDDVRARSLVAAMRFNKEVEEDVEGYGELYMRDDDELLSALSEIIDPAIAKRAIENIGVVVDACNVEMTHGTHYPVFPTTDGETAEMRLRRLATEGISKRYPGKAWTKEYEERMEYELGVIQSMGYSDYLCIVQDFLEYGRKLGYECPEKIGYTIGPGRGSGVGSIVCYLTGITSVDPMRYGLLFERFLNPERVSMPEYYWAFIVNPIAQGCAA